jgi:predicted ATPase
MRAVIDWSWELLEPWEKAALAQCSAFVGGFTLEAAENVIDLSPHAHAPAVLDVVQALREKSLLVTRPDTMRLGSYETIREYAAARLAESGLAGAVHARQREILRGARRRLGLGFCQDGKP